MKKKLSNEEIDRNIKRRKILRWIIIVFGVATISLALASLWFKLTPVYALLAYVVVAICSHIRNKIEVE